MENSPKTPPEAAINRPENADFDSKTRPENRQTDQNSKNSGNGSCLTGPIPDRLKVPKAFKFQERYTSPTDLMMSPISKGLLARTRKLGMLLPPPNESQPKVLN